MISFLLGFFLCVLIFAVVYNKSSRLSWTGWLNILILQFLFIRLARKGDDHGKIIGYQWLYIIVPFSGWFNEYIFLYKSKKFKE